MAKKATRGAKKVRKVMGEFERGDLKSSSGHKVTSKDQALAIAMSEKRRAMHSTLGEMSDGGKKKF